MFSRINDRDYDKWKLASPYDNEDEEICDECECKKCKCDDYARGDYERDLAKDEVKDE